YVLLFHFFLFYHSPASTELYTLSLHDALPIYACYFNKSYHIYCQIWLPDLFLEELTFLRWYLATQTMPCLIFPLRPYNQGYGLRSEEHTSELQSRENLVCRLLLEKKKRYK